MVPSLASEAANGVTNRALGAIGLALVGCAAGSVALGDLTHGQLPAGAVLYFAAALLYLAALGAVLRYGPADDGAAQQRALWVVLGVAVGARLVLLAADPSLSHDIARYVWEGRIQWAGFNPYAVAPSDDALRPLRDATYLRVNHPHVAAVYGPLLQLLFAGLAALPGGVIAFKAAFVVVDLLVVALIVAGLRAQGAHPALALVYAWHPLALLEVAGQGHLEVIPIAALLAAIQLEARGRVRWAAVALGASIGTKYLALLVLPAFVLAGRGARDRATRLAYALAPGLLAALPYLGAGAAGGAGLTTYGRIWRFNDGGFFALDALLQGSGAAAAAVRALPRPLLAAIAGGPVVGDPARYATLLQAPTKAVVALGVIAVVAWTAWPRAEHAAPGAVTRRAAVAAVAVFLLGSPVVHPWYALWIVPFLPGWIARGRPAGASAWLLLTLLLPLSYAVLLRYDGVSSATWIESPWVRAAEYAPFAALALASPLLGRGSKPPGTRTSVMNCP